MSIVVARMIDFKDTGQHRYNKLGTYVGEESVLNTIKPVQLQVFDFVII